MTDNETRADRAMVALRLYVESKRDVFENSSSEIADLIADLLHLAARSDEGDDPIDSTLRLARMHFDASMRTRKKPDHLLNRPNPGLSPMNLQASSDDPFGHSKKSAITCS